MTPITQIKKKLNIEGAPQEIVRWGTSSIEEVRLASELIDEISPDGEKYNQAQQLYEVIVRLFKKERGLTRLWAIYENDITSNLVSELAYRIESRDSDVKKTGSYFTPQILAADMVQAAAQNWKKRNKNQRVEDATWYDPCVGGGIFPVAIADYLLGLGLNPKKILGQIIGSDINPLFVEATKIRIALVLSKGNEEQFTKLYKFCKDTISEEDSLLNYAENQNFFTKTKTSVDIVIGNPPYVRSNSIASEIKNALRTLYPSIWSGTTDLYMFFIAHGLNALKKGGVLCYVSPATFQRTSSASPIRKYILQNASIEAVFDFDELEVFQNVGSHIGVYILCKDAKNTKTKYALYASLPLSAPLTRVPFPQTEISLPNFEGQAWSFHPEFGSILPLLEKNSAPLREYFQIYSGIKTGLKNAYEITASQHSEVLSDERSQQYVFPLLKPRQIERWTLQWNNTYQIVVPRGQVLDSKSNAYKHLLFFKEELAKRTDLRRGDPWYSLRDCAYLDLFNKPKIVFRDISSYPRFALDTEGMVVVDGAFFIPTTDLFLLGLLNSKVGEFYFKSHCATIGSVGSRGRLRFKKVYVSQFPIPKNVDGQARLKIEECVEQILSGDTIVAREIEQKLNDMVLDVYRIPLEQRQIILKS